MRACDAGPSTHQISKFSHCTATLALHDLPSLCTIIFCTCSCNLQPPETELERSPDELSQRSAGKMLGYKGCCELHHSECESQIVVLLTTSYRQFCMPSDNISDQSNLFTDCLRETVCRLHTWKLLTNCLYGKSVNVFWLPISGCPLLDIVETRIQTERASRALHEVSTNINDTKQTPGMRCMPVLSRPSTPLFDALQAS